MWFIRPSFPSVTLSAVLIERGTDSEERAIRTWLSRLSRLSRFERISRLSTPTSQASQCDFLKSLQTLDTILTVSHHASAASHVCLTLHGAASRLLLLLL